MFDASDRSPAPESLLRRLTANPRQLRRRAIATIIAAALLFGALQVADLGFAGSLLAVLCWIIGPLAALGLASADAFFIQHGRGTRRVILTIVASAAAALGSCAVLAVVTVESQNRPETLVSASLYALLLAAVCFALAALEAVVIGRSGAYLADRIDTLSRDDW